jgi:hypothetical protein
MGLPLGGLAGLGGGRGVEREAVARKYPIEGELIGADEVAEWERLGPVIGEDPT